MPADRATVPPFSHNGWRSMTEMCAMCNSTWGELMHRPKDHAEGKDPVPLHRDSDRLSLLWPRFSKV
jgi:hypothetical protein